MKFAGLPKSVFPVELNTQNLHVHGHMEKMQVSQFPVKLNFAWTCHKLQGKTEDKVILGCTNRVLNYNYTAFSRIRTLAALHVLKGVKLTLDVLIHPCDKHDMLVAEMARLDTLSTTTLAQMPSQPQQCILIARPVIAPSHGLDSPGGHRTSCPHDGLHNSMMHQQSTFRSRLEHAVFTHSCL